jgi:hypothetical protein
MAVDITVTRVDGGSAIVKRAANGRFAKKTSQPRFKVKHDGYAEDVIYDRKSKRVVAFATGKQKAHELVNILNRKA